MHFLKILPKRTKVTIRRGPITGSVTSLLL